MRTHTRMPITCTRTPHALTSHARAYSQRAHAPTLPPTHSPMHTCSLARLRYARTRAHTHAHSPMHTHVETHHMHTHTHTHPRTHPCAHTHPYTLTHSPRTHMHTPTLPCIHMQTRSHAHTHSPPTLTSCTLACAFAHSNASTCRPVHTRTRTLPCVHMQTRSHAHPDTRSCTRTHIHALSSWTHTCTLLAHYALTHVHTQIEDCRKRFKNSFSVL
jgi:hypothetical protein